jgi:hypothetical protein
MGDANLDESESPYVAKVRQAAGNLETQDVMRPGALGTWRNDVSTPLIWRVRAGAADTAAW